jgi:hypothetical protein
MEPIGAGRCRCGNNRLPRSEPMRRLLPIVGLAALLVALAPTAALAKGPTSASIDGPGSGGSIDVGGDPGSGEPGRDATLSQLAEHAGLFTVGFGDNVSQLTDHQPDGDLGPEYRIEWTVPSTEGSADVVVQRLYPYADAGAVTYTEAGQAYMGMETLGGWYAGGDALTKTLVGTGLPAEPPSTGPDARPIAYAIVALCALGLLALWIGRTVRARQHAVA